MRNTFIYGLKVIGCDEIRYIGKSDNPISRLKKHIYNTKLKIKQNKKLTHKDNWIIKNKFNIDFVILEECDYDVWQIREIFYINKYKNLTNTSSGGLGGAGIIYKLSYDELKKWVKNNLNVNSKTSWYKYIKNNKIPNYVPRDPYIVYKNRGWISWGDFLSTNKIWDNYVEYHSYVESKKLLKNLNIKSANDYIKMFNEGLIPNKIPKKPNRFYKNRGWVSWGDFLNNDFIANQLRVFYTYDEFKNKIKNLNLKTFTSFKKYITENKSDKKIPTNPNIVYKNNGWVGWLDIIN
jgi:hypothetical protein